MLSMALTLSLISLSTLAILASHPTSFVMIIIAQTLLISMMASLSQKTFWFSYTLFLVFLGGMLILFSYITSLASNNPLSMEGSMPTIIILTIIISIVALLWHQGPYTTSDSSSILPQSFYFSSTLNKFYFQMSTLTLLMIMYLLITLLIVVNITMIHKGPLRPQII